MIFCSASSAASNVQGTWSLLNFTPSNEISSNGYDNLGNGTYDGTYYYTYDAESRLIKVGTSSGGSNVATYTYDALGRRQGQTTSAGAFWYMFDLQNNPTAKLNQSNNTVVSTETYVGGRHLAFQNGSTTFFSHTDWLHTTRMVTNLSGASVQVCTDLPFGDNPSCSAPDDPAEYYAGLRLDAEDNLDHAQFRQYSPAQGHWMTPDPAGLAAVDLTNPQSWNRNAYVLNNPVSLIDPLGLDQCVWDDGSSDDRPEDGGASEPDCAEQGGNWASGTDATVTVNGDNNGNTLDTITTWDQISISFIPGTACSSALQTAGTNAGAMNRYYRTYQGTISNAANANGISPSFLASIGIRESGLQNIPQQGGGQGLGIFQIDLGIHPNVSQAQALNPSFAANFAANMLNSDMSSPAASYPNLNPTQLSQATAASYNFGVGNISGNPNAIDVGTTGNNYGSNVVAIAGSCF